MAIASDEKNDFDQKSLGEIWLDYTVIIHSKGQSGFDWSLFKVWYQKLLEDRCVDRVPDHEHFGTSINQ